MPSTNFPPVKPQPLPGTQTSDRYGNVISTRPAPAPEVPPRGPTAPTSDRWGHVIGEGDAFTPSRPAIVPTFDRPSIAVTTQPTPAPEAPTQDPVISARPSSMPPVLAHPAPGTQTSDRWGNVISTRPPPAPQTPPAQPRAPTSDRWGHVIDWP